MSSDSSTLRPHGGYRRLRSFQVTEIIYDGTVVFCDRFVDKRSRTHDQMVQAARSGRQNIAEGSRASATSSQTELRLVNVARASLDELLLDYEDFLRQRGLKQWEKADPEARRVREAGGKREGVGIKMGGGARGSLRWDGTLGRAEEGAGLGDGRVRRESREGRRAGTECGAERDSDGKRWSLRLP